MARMFVRERAMRVTSRAVRVRGGGFPEDTRRGAPMRRPRAAAPGETARAIRHEIDRGRRRRAAQLTRACAPFAVFPPGTAPRGPQRQYDMVRSVQRGAISAPRGRPAPLNGLAPSPARQEAD